MTRFLLLASAMVLLPACDKLIGTRNLAGATTYVSDARLARERILITLRDIRPANRNFSPTLDIVIEPDGTVVTRRMRFFFEPDPSMPMVTLEEPIDLFGPGSFDVVDRTHRATLTPAQANIIRRKLSVFRPETLTRDYANISPATMPSCSRSTSHDPVSLVCISSHLAENPALSASWDRARQPTKPPCAKSLTTSAGNCRRARPQVASNESSDYGASLLNTLISDPRRLASIGSTPALGSPRGSLRA